MRSVEEKPWRRSPYAPFLTSTLQQEAGRKLRFTAARTMRVAQDLYEAGHITYMRTDSTTLSDQALSAARSVVRDLYGADYLPAAAPPLRQAGQERPGGARGHPAGRRGVPPPRAQRARRRPAAPVRAHLEADGGVADVRCAGPQRAGAPGGHQLGRRGRRVRGQRAGRIRSPASCGLTSRDRTTPRPSSRTERCACPAWYRGKPLSAEALVPEGHTTQPPARLHRGVPGKGAGRNGGRAAVDLCHDHRYGPEPWVRVEEGHRPGAVLDGLCRRRPPRATLRQAGRLRLHGPDGRGPRRYRPGGRGAVAVADPFLFRRRREPRATTRA